MLIKPKIEFMTDTNKFGGNWTENKIEILVEYAGAYLNIMNKYAKQFKWKLMYFDGFAGSGFIKKGSEENQRLIIGAARRILEIEKPRSFDMYYFVEKEENLAISLETHTKDEYSNENVHIARSDCNEKILKLSHYLKDDKGKDYKVLAYIDPCGMQLDWKSLVALQKLSVDVWILIPTGMGVNRLLKKNGQISDAWQEKLERFLGMNRKDIINYFYKEKVEHTLFGTEIKLTKEEEAIKKSVELYVTRLEQLFDYVSQPYILKNSTNSVMFHFLMASNNKTAVKIANDIVVKYNKQN